MQETIYTVNKNDDLNKLSHIFYFPLFIPKAEPWFTPLGRPLRIGEEPHMAGPWNFGGNQTKVSTIFSKIITMLKNRSTSI